MVNAALPVAFTDAKQNLLDLPQLPKYLEILYFYRILVVGMGQPVQAEIALFGSA